MSKVNELIVEAVSKGYFVTNDGTIINPKGKIINGQVRYDREKRAGKGRDKARAYRYISYKNHKLPVHRVVAYLKFGERAFEAECVRHLNDNPLDNSWSNIEIGTFYDNSQDAIRNRRFDNYRRKSGGYNS